jgi:hypothetical protein
MTAKTTIAAGLLALATIGYAVPAGAAGLTLNVGTDGLQVELVRDRDERHGDRDGWRHDRRHHHGWSHGWHRTLSPHEVRLILRHRGYSHVRYLDRRGPIYQAQAVDYRGRYRGLVISAHNGAILQSYRIY